MAASNRRLMWHGILLFLLGLVTGLLEANDLLVAYTDGVTESEDSQGVAFGHTRLESTLCDSDAEDAEDVLQHIVDELSAHSAGCSQADDITLVVLRVAAK